MTDFKRAANIKKGTAATIAFGLFSFAIFVLVRNDWAVNMDDLGGAVKKALGTRTVEEQQESIQSPSGKAASRPWSAWAPCIWQFS